MEYEGVGWFMVLGRECVASSQRQDAAARPAVHRLGQPNPMEMSIETRATLVQLPKRRILNPLVAAAGLACCLAICLPLGGCGLLIGHVVRQSEHKKEAESQVVATLARYAQAVRDLDAERTADLFLPSGDWLHNADKPLVGHAQIAGYIKTLASARLVHFDIQASSTTLDDAQVNQHGSYTQTLQAADGQQTHVSGEFDAVWLHAPDGRWLLSHLRTRSP
jgi:uncharacterized protein (TIGR02246 family)